MMAQINNWSDRQIESQFDAKTETALAFLCFFWSLSVREPLSSSKLVRSRRKGVSVKAKPSSCFEFDVEEVEACDVIVFFHLVVPMTWVAVSSAGVALLLALNFLFSMSISMALSLVNLHLLLARPSGLDIPFEAHVSAAVADVPRRRPLAPTGKNE